MNVRMLAAVVAMVAAPTIVAAQDRGAPPPLVTTPQKETSQFAFLIGQWKVVATPAATGLAARIHGVPKLVRHMEGVAGARWLRNRG